MTRYARIDAAVGKMEAMCDALERRCDSTREERIAMVRNLYERPGTPGEKAAAYEALKRMGVDVDNLPPLKRDVPPPPPPPKTPRGPKRFKVTLQYEWNGRTLYFGPFELEALDEIDAEMKIRKKAQAHWTDTVGGKKPEFKRYQTQRI